MSVSQSKSSMLSYDDIYQDQLVAIYRLTTGDTLFIAPKGYGKAMIGQTAAQKMLDAGAVRRVLVVAPLKVVQLTWMVEYDNWYHLEIPAFAIGDQTARVKAVASHKRIVVTNLDNLAWILNEYPGEFDGVVIDEISKLKAVGGVGAKAMRRYRRRYVNWCVGMSATPVAEAGIDLYAQAGIVDNFQALGKNQDRFRRKYFYPIDYNQTQWRLIPGMGEELAQALEDVVYLADAEAYESTLPDLHDHIYWVELPPVAREAYDEMCKDMVTGPIQAMSAAVKVGKLQQICQGAAYASDKEVIWFHERKLQIMRQIRKLFDDDQSQLIMYQFNFEREWLAARGYNILADDPVKYERQWNNREIRDLAVHPQSAGHGLNLQRGGHHLIALGPIWSADQWDQMIGRLRRRGQTRDVHRHIIVCRNTVDEMVLDRVAGKGNQERAIMEHLKDRSSC